LEIEEKAVVDELLDPKGDLGNIHGAVVAEADFDGDIEQGVVVRMNREGYGGGQERREIEVEINLREMLEKRCGVT
jgi:hypothetical protein